ncbi:hypothetical protein WS67_14800 [Burkholderia singularis]|uniref:Uncharacterized protein n=2 Tax=Burkholderiaceae TaxID=119060 RepID=A0A103E1X2_9BURK|nr:hypothetical protein AQ611_00155 [Burkholderia sp. Bp7605]KVE26848.1 hypothetical protein WS67_14800 [Burkholderia singularis]SMG00295.1 hypothetical protein BSIN_3364 [Burkholderia singularis]
MVELVEEEIRAVSGGTWNPPSISTLPGIISALPGIVSALPGIISDIIANFPHDWISTLPMPIGGSEVKPIPF